MSVDERRTAECRVDERRTAECRVDECLGTLTSYVNRPKVISKQF